MVDGLDLMGRYRSHSLEHLRMVQDAPVAMMALVNVRNVTNSS